MKLHLEGPFHEALALMSVINLSPVFDLVGYADGPYPLDGNNTQVRLDTHVRLVFEIRPASPDPGR